MSKVSIIIPIFNAELTISNTIISIITQPFDSLELILIDDGSTDSSLNICLHYASIDSRIIVKSQENKGVSSARNKGLNLATGDWIYFLDSDDCLNKDFFNKLSPLLNNQLADVIQFGSVKKKSYESDSILSYRQSLKNNSQLFVNNLSDFIEISNIGALCVWLHLIRRDVLIKNNLSFQEDMNYNEDMLFMYQVLVSSTKYLFIGEAIHTQILVPNSLSRSPMNETKINNRLLLVERVIKLAFENPEHQHTLINEANQLLKGYFGSISFYLIEHEPLYKILNSRELKFLNKSYKVFYKKYKRLLKGFYPKIASIHTICIAYPLKYKIKIQLEPRN